MKLHKYFCFLWLLAPAIICCQPKKLTAYVNPFIGTGGHGHTYPGATVPFGMVQLSPDNGTQGWDWCSGYNYSDSVIAGFSHTHLSGTGIGDLCDISILPLINRPMNGVHYTSRFFHKEESAAPGYYSVKLYNKEKAAQRTNGIHARLTTTEHCGFHEYRFPNGVAPMIQLDLGYALNWDAPVECALRRLNDSTFTGYRFSKGWAKDQRVFFALRLSRSITGKAVVSFTDSMPSAGDTRGKRIISYFHFSPGGGNVIKLKVGLSMANEAGALKSLDEIPHWNFDAVQHAADAQWERELSKIKVESTDKNFLTTFYTALYHTCLAPVQFTDLNGAYRGADKKIHTSKNGKRYTVHSLWDTFRALNPLFTVTQAERVAAIINSYLDFYDQSGLLPVWDLMFNETNTMTGYHAIPVIADAILKNIKGFDHKKAYAAMQKSAMQNIRGTEAYRKYGFVPQDKHGWSVTMTLEYAYDDWCIAQVAKKFGDSTNFYYYKERAKNYRNLFDARIGFFRAKKSDSTWVEPFDPFLSEHGFNGQYIEGTAWQHTWFVPHDVPHFSYLLGGPQGFMSKLDSLWAISSEMHGADISVDISGMIGQYAHGNEPSHHIPYLYAAAGIPHKTAEKVRQIMKKFYSNSVDGLSGNDDCGQMSAWYVWSALGMYPMNACGGEYMLGSPLVDKAVIQLPGRKTFSIVVKNNSDINMYIKKMTLNGKPMNGWSIRHSDLVKGGRLELVMGDTP